MNRAPDDDEANRTTIRPAAPATRTGRATAPVDAQNSSMFGHTLAEGTMLGEFEVTGLIGEGGFGIVYLAWDGSLMRDVAIKEYMPSSLAGRGQGTDSVIVKAERHTDTFRAGLKSFVNEARLLARFDHPSLLKVYRFWEANGTAYMAMPYYRGPTLKATLASMGQPPDQARLMSWLRPLLDAMAVLHNANCFHRDIAPDNILLTESGPLLLDFGAARRVIGDMTHALTVVLKPGFAPIEQYGDVSTMAQGAWTDLYALASVVYCAITGKPPVSSVERLMSDTMPPLSTVAAGRYSERFLRAIDAALAVRPQDRTQNVAQFWELLDADNPRHAPLPAVVSQAAVDSEFQALTHPQLHEPRQAPTGMLHTPTGMTRHAAPATGLSTTRAATPHTLPSPSVSPPAAAAPQTGMRQEVRFTQVPIRTELRHKAAPPRQAAPEPAPTATPTRAAPQAAGATTLNRSDAIRAADTTTLRTGVARSATSTAPAAATAAAPATRKTPAPAEAPASKTPLYLIGAIAALLLIGSVAVLLRSRTPAPQELPTSAPGPASTTVPTVPPAPVRAPAPAPAPAPSPSPAPVAETPAPAAAAPAPSETPTGPPPAPNRVDAPADAPADTPAPTVKASKPALPKPDKPVVLRPPPVKLPAAEPTAANAATRARCSDILTKGSLEPLSADETAYLKRECR